MHPRRFLLAAGLLLLIPLAACSPHRRGTPLDLGPIAPDMPGVDAGEAVDAGSEDLGLGLDAGFDAGASDLGVDLGPADLGVDFGPPDLGFDAGPPDLGFDAGRPDLGFDAGTAGSGLLLLSEIASGGPGGSSDEFIEIYNPGTAAFDASGLRVEYRAAAGAIYSLVATLPAGTAISAHRFFLVAGTGYTGLAAADLPAAFTDALAGAGGHVRLVTAAGTELDRCGWGSAVAPEGTPAPAGLTGTQSRERRAYGTSTATTMALGGADALRGNGSDTNDNGVDFLVREVAEPQNSSSLEVP